MIEITPESYEQIKAAGLTKHSREEIFDATKEFADAVAETHALIEEANRQITAYTAAEATQSPMSAEQNRIFIAWNCYMDEVCSRAYVYAKSYQRNLELFPIARWRRVATAQRTAAQRLKSALEAT